MDKLNRETLIEMKDHLEERLKIWEQLVDSGKEVLRIIEEKILEKEKQK